MKYLSITVLTFFCSTTWGFDFEEEFKKVLKDGVQKKIEEKSDAATSSALLGLVGTSQEEEITIGRQIAGNLLGASALVKDKKLQTYVNNVGRWVANQSERPDLPWHFGVIESSDVNAFAAPGGYIFLTRGLYRLLQNEAELAGVLGHEIGHVIRKHHLKILQKSSLVDLGGKLISKQVGGNDKVQKLIGSGAEIVARSLDQNAEFEADRIAVVLAARAGYDAFALPEVLQQIGHFSKDDGSVALLFKTHPHPDDRLEKLGLAMNTRLEDVKGKTLETRFYRIKP
ncbi:M48 family metalloprotease [Candidatus Nitrotoga sp. HW29]|uniref:M48 family metalloprotease n=1 Tax=Candidatus Nitrotoga sp. HW29 TaxID=2886963 RepID=UPI001EF30AAC|nr:M48 family metalloprotease [Candidatus Nitrotoga sp. HW29]